MEVAIGVIGLSLQLIDSAVKIKGVIGTYRSASTEANRLALKVELIEAICNTITKNFDQNDSDCQPSELFGTLGARLLGSIQCTLDELHSIVSRLEKRASKDRALKTTGVFFLSKRDDISRLSKCLDEDLSHLQLLLTTSLASRPLLAPQAETQLISSTSNLNSTTLASSFEVESSPKLFMATSVQTTCRQIIRVFGFHGQSQTVSTTKRSRWGDSQETTSTSETRSFTFGHARLSYMVEIDFLQTPLDSMTYALNIRHIVTRKVDDLLYDKVQKIFFVGHVSELQSLLSARQINLSSSIGCFSLFELAMIYLRPDICRFLVQQNAHLCLQDSYSKPAVGGSHYRQYLDAYETSRRVSGTVDAILLTQASPVAKLRSTVFDLPSQEAFFSYYDRFQQAFPDEIDQEELNDTYWEAAVYMMHEPCTPFSWLDDTPAMTNWIKIFTDIIRRGVNIHRRCYRDNLWGLQDHPMGTALRYIMETTSCQRELEVILTRWLRILQCCGVDTGEYIRNELPGIQKMCKSWHLPSFGDWPRKTKTKTISGFKVPTWHRWVSPAHRAHEAAHEFRNFGEFLPGRNHDTPVDFETFGNGLRPHIRWKNAEFRPGYGDKWPFAYSVARDLRREEIEKALSFVESSPEDAQRVLESFDRAQELIKERLERRQLRKLYKSGYLRREKKTMKVPGAWTD